MEHMNEVSLNGTHWFWWLVWIIIWLGIIVGTWNILDVLFKKRTSE